MGLVTGKLRTLVWMSIPRQGQDLGVSENLAPMESVVARVRRASWNNVRLFARDMIAGERR